MDHVPEAPASNFVLPCKPAAKDGDENGRGVSFFVIDTETNAVTSAGFCMPMQRWKPGSSAKGEVHVGICEISVE